MPGKLGGSIVLDGEKEFNAALKDIDAAIRQSSAEMNLMAEKYKSGNDSVGVLNETLEISERQVRQCAEKVELYKASLSEMENSTDASTKKIDAMRLSLTKAETQLQKAKNTYDETAKKIENIGDESDDASDGIDEITKAVEKLEQAANGIKNDINSLEDSIDDLGDEASEASRKIGDAVSSLNAMEVAGNVFDVISGGIDVIVGLGEHSEELQSEFDELNAVLDECKVAIADALVPIVSEFGDEIADVATKLTGYLINALQWVGDHGEAIAQTIKFVAVAVGTLGAAILVIKIATGGWLTVIGLLIAALAGLVFQFNDVKAAIDDFGNEGYNSAEAYTQNLTTGFADNFNQSMDDASKSIEQSLLNATSQDFSSYGKNAGNSYSNGFEDGLRDMTYDVNSGTSRSNTARKNNSVRGDEEQAVAERVLSEDVEFNITLVIDGEKLAEVIYEPLSKTIKRKELKGLA